MSNTNLFALDMAALNSTVVMQGHTDYCAAHGHATYTGPLWDTELCPRCGALTTPPVQATATVPAPPIYPLAFILDCLVGDGFDSIESEWYWAGFPESYATWERLGFTSHAFTTTQSWRS